MTWNVRVLDRRQNDRADPHRTGREFGDGDAAPPGTEQLACALCSGVPPWLLDLICQDLTEQEKTARQCDLAYRMDDQNSLPFGSLEATEPISTGRLSRRPDIPAGSKERR